LNDPVSEQLAAYNEGNVERFVACYAPDCVFEDGAGKRLMGGHAEMRTKYAALFSASPNLQCTLLARIHIGKYTIDHEQISGRIPPMNNAVVIYRVENGVIGHVRFLREDS
jgi:hypothetical protein